MNHWDFIYSFFHSLNKCYWDLSVSRKEVFSPPVLWVRATSHSWYSPFFKQSTSSDFHPSHYQKLLREKHLKNINTKMWISDSLNLKSIAQVYFNFNVNKSYKQQQSLDNIISDIIRRRKKAFSERGGPVISTSGKWHHTNVTSPFQLSCLLIR